MKVLLTTPVLSFPPVGGPELRVANSIKALARLCQLDVVPICPISHSTTDFLTSTCNLVMQGPRLLEGSEFPGVWRLRSVVRLVPNFVRAYGKSIRQRMEICQQAKMLSQHAVTHNMNVVWFSYGCISYPLMRKVRSIMPTLPLICDTDSVYSQFISRELPYEESAARRRQITREARQKIAEEKRWVDFCDVTTAVCDADAKYYAEIARDSSRIKMFRNCIDPADYEGVVPPRSNHKRPNLIMLGSYYSAHSPMVRSAKWIVDKVLPEVWRVIPQVHLYIVGRGSERHLRHLESDRVTVTGFVDSTLLALSKTYRRRVSTIAVRSGGCKV